MDYLDKIAEFLSEQNEVLFGYSDKYIEVFIRKNDGDFEANIFESKTDYLEEKEPVDGGIFTGESAREAIDFFTEGLL